MEVAADKGVCVTMPTFFRFGFPRKDRSIRPPPGQHAQLAKRNPIPVAKDPNMLERIQNCAKTTKTDLSHLIRHDMMWHNVI